LRRTGSADNTGLHSGDVLVRSEGAQNPVGQASEDALRLSIDVDSRSDELSLNDNRSGVVLWTDKFNQIVGIEIPGIKRLWPTVVGAELIR